MVDPEHTMDPREADLLYSKLPLAEARLVVALREKQLQAELSDKLFAKLLGIARQQWQATRTGNARVGLALIAGAYQRWPELKNLVLSFLSSRTDIYPRQGRKSDSDF